jgi:Kef-type K+ transport system membrane component KefB
VAGLACGLALSLAGAGARPVFAAVVLTSTSAGLLLPLLKDAGQERTPFGQLVMTAAALAEVATIVMLSLLFSATSATTGGRLASLAMFLILLAVIGLALGRVRNLTVLDRMLDRLEDRSAQLRVRAALALALAFAVLASRFGFASILGAFAAGLLVRTIDLNGRAPHPQFQTKLEGIGFGFLVPVFFITTGVQFDARALLSHPAAIAEIPLFLAALLIVRGTPALAYARRLGQRRAAVAGLMQATSLTFVIVAAQIGTATGQISQATAAALLAAGLLSAALFPAAAVKLLTTHAPHAEGHLSHSGGITTRVAAHGPF